MVSTRMAEGRERRLGRPLSGWAEGPGGLPGGEQEAVENGLKQRALAPEISLQQHLDRTHPGMPFAPASNLFSSCNLRNRPFSFPGPPRPANTIF